MLDLVLVEQHVGDAVCDGELPSRLGADEVAVDDLDLEEDVMGLLEELVVGLVVVGERGGEIAQLVQLLRGATHLGPVQLGDDAGHKVGVELHLQDLHVFGL